MLTRFKILECPGKQCNLNNSTKRFMKGELDYIMLCIEVITILFVWINNIFPVQIVNMLLHPTTCSLSPVQPCHKNKYGWTLIEIYGDAKLIHEFQS